MRCVPSVNAVQIAQYAKSDQFASDTFQKASSLLSQAEDYQTRKEWRPAIMTAKEATQQAEDEWKAEMERTALFTREFFEACTQTLTILARLCQTVTGVSATGSLL